MLDGVCCLSTILERDVKLQGLPLSDGVAVGRICMFNENRHSSISFYKIEQGGLSAETKRLDDAIKEAAVRLDDIIERVRDEIGPAEAEIFVAQKMIMGDDVLRERAHKLINDEQLNAELSVTRVLDDYETRLQQMDDKYIRERASDFGEVKRRILDVLGNTTPNLQCDQPHCQRGRNRVVVAAELTPSLTVEVSARHTLGFVTERGGQSSHAAILARSMGVPAVSGIDGVRDKVACGEEILVNGYTGEVVLNPTEKTVLEMRAKYSGGVRKPTAVAPVKGVSVRANVSTFDEVADAVEMAAEGIGLYRTEIDVITARVDCDEDALYQTYRSVLSQLSPVYFRIFDIGSDKPLPSLGVSDEDNPALGLRGTRLLFAKPDVFRSQVRALARLSQKYAVHVMYPMIIDLGQFVEARRIFTQLAEGIDSGTIYHGAMFEVPSACLAARRLYSEIDFGSIGTNDLIQYLYAIDRNNNAVAADFKPEREELWELLALVIKAAEESCKPLSVCGELAGNPLYLKRMLSLGLKDFSVNARVVPVIRQAVAEQLGED